MKQVWMSAMFLVCVGAAAAYADAETHAERHAAFHAAFEACATENGLTRPEPGTRPSEADRATMDACLKAKGFDHHHGPPPDRQAATDSSAAE